MCFAFSAFYPRYELLRDPSSPMRDTVREQNRKTLRQAIHVWLDQYTEDFQVYKQG